MLAVGAHAQDITVTIKDHRFEPTELRVPANKRVSIYRRQPDPTPEEFESLSMKVRKESSRQIQGPGAGRTLAPGALRFFGDFNQATDQGRVDRRIRYLGAGCSRHRLSRSFSKPA